MNINYSLLVRLKVLKSRVCGDEEKETMKKKNSIQQKNITEELTNTFIYIN